jgi:hypothetical protein
MLARCRTEHCEPARDRLQWCSAPLKAIAARYSIQSCDGQKTISDARSNTRIASLARLSRPDARDPGHNLRKPCLPLFLVPVSYRLPHHSTKGSLPAELTDAAHGGTMSYYFAIVGTQDNPLFEYEFGTSKQGGDGQARFSEQVRPLNQLILHSSLDIAEEVQWSHGNM